MLAVDTFKLVYYFDFCLTKPTLNIVLAVFFVTLLTFLLSIFFSYSLLISFSFQSTLSILEWPVALCAFFSLSRIAELKVPFYCGCHIFSHLSQNLKIPTVSWMPVNVILRGQSTSMESRKTKQMPSCIQSHEPNYDKRKTTSLAVAKKIDRFQWINEGKISKWSHFIALLWTICLMNKNTK